MANHVVLPPTRCCNFSGPPAKYIAPEKLRRRFSSMAGRMTCAAHNPTTQLPWGLLDVLLRSGLENGNTGRIRKRVKAQRRSQP
jgi:hypothetical protein